MASPAFAPNAPRVADDLFAANQSFASGFEKGDLPMPPARQVAIITCMDARLHPETFLGLAIGDAHVIRNAGGRVSEDALRSLVISERLLGTTEILVIHHTECGMLTFQNADLVAKIRADLGDAAAAAAQKHDFLTFSDLEQSVRDDIAILEASPLIPDSIPVTGAIYDVHTGKLQKVD